MSTTKTTLNLWENADGIHVEEIAGSQEISLETEIDFDHQPYEGETLTYPGCEESVWVNGIQEIGGEQRDLSYLLNEKSKQAERFLEELREVCTQAIHDDYLSRAIDRYEDRNNDF